MSANFSDTLEKELSVKQEILIAALVAGNSIVASATATGVSERTAHTWLKQPHFKQAYEAAKQAAYDEALERLRSQVNTALDALIRNMTATKGNYVQVQAASKFMDLSFEHNKTRILEARLTELEELVKGMQQ